MQAKLTISFIAKSGKKINGKLPAVTGRVYLSAVEAWISKRMGSTGLEPVTPCV